MTDALKYLEKLAARARLEMAPPTRVSSRVLQRLAQDDIPVEQIIRPFAMVTVLAAIVTLILTIQLYDLLSDPLTGLFLLAAEVMP